MSKKIRAIVGMLVLCAMLISATQFAYAQEPEEASVVAPADETSSGDVGIMPLAENFTTFLNSLALGTNATVSSQITCKSKASSIKLVNYLQKSNTQTWFVVNTDTYSTTNAYSLSGSDTCAVSSGTYRIKTVATTVIGGVTYTDTIYSASKTK